MDINSEMMIYKTIAITELKEKPSKFSDTIKIIPENRLLIVSNFISGFAKTNQGFINEDDIEFAFCYHEEET